MNFKKMLKYGFPLYLSTVLLGASTQLQTIVLSFFTPDVEIGNFKAATNFITLLSALSASTASALFPAFSQLNGHLNQTRIFFKLATKCTSMITIPVSVTLLLFSTELVKIVYGEAFLPASLFLSLYVTVYFLVGFGWVIHESFFNGVGETKTTLKWNIVKFVVFLGLAPLLTQTFSVLGIILAILCSEGAATIFGAYNAKHNFGAGPDYPSIFRIFLAAFVAAIPSFFIVYTQLFPAIIILFLGSLLYLLIYITLLPLMGVLSKSEVDNIQKATEKIRLLGYIMKYILKFENKILLRTDSKRNK